MSKMRMPEMSVVRFTESDVIVASSIVLSGANDESDHNLTVTRYGTDIFSKWLLTCNNDFAAATSELTIPDNGIGVYEDVFGGYGDKIIGLIIIYSSGLEIKNIDLRMV